jgi:hypothetical protein
MAEKLYQIFMILLAFFIGVLVSSHIFDGAEYSGLIQELQNFFKAVIPVLGTGALVKYLLT